MERGEEITPKEREIWERRGVYYFVFQTSDRGLYMEGPNGSSRPIEDGMAHGKNGWTRHSPPVGILD
ncbi:MAG: hypothetical protein WCV59_03240 [Parcubacteria group bacterium]